MSYKRAVSELIELARANGGVVLSAHVEADAALSQARDLVRAAARALAGRTTVVDADEPDGREWFPYSSLSFTELDGHRKTRATS